MKKCPSPYRMRLVWVSLIVSSLFWASVASATTVLYMDLVKLIEASDVIVRGTVESSEFKYDEKRQNVMTHYTVTVQESFFGKTEKQLTFVQWGGMWNGNASRIPGDAKFNKGEDTILFLNEHQGTLYLAALGQSKYAVTKSKDGKRIVSRDLSDIGFFRQGDDIPVISKDVETAELDAFVPELQSLIAAVKGGLK